MGGTVQLLVLAMVGAFLLWFGYRLFIGFGLPGGGPGGRRFKGETGVAGAPRTCPVCAARLLHGERVKSSAYPSMGGSDRLMHIFGCPYCLTFDFPRERACPVCGKRLSPNSHLIARIFDKPGRSHVHVLGCSICRGPRSGR